MGCGSSHPKPASCEPSPLKGSEERMEARWVSPEVSVDRSRRKHGNIEPESWGTLLAQTEAHATSPLTQRMKELALLALRQHFMFASFSVARLSRLVDQMASRSFSPGSRVITQGDSGAHEMFVVFSGEVEVMVRKEDGRGIQVASIKPGGFLGEMALLYPTSRTATCTAVGPEQTVCLCLSRASYQTSLLNREQTDAKEGAESDREIDADASMFELAPWLREVVSEEGVVDINSHSSRSPLSPLQYAHPHLVCRTLLHAPFPIPCPYPQPLPPPAYYQSSPSSHPASCHSPHPAACPSLRSKLARGGILFDGRLTCPMFAVVVQGTLKQEREGGKVEKLSMGDVVVSGSVGGEALLAAVLGGCSFEGRLLLLGASKGGPLLASSPVQVMSVPLCQVTSHLTFPPEALSSPPLARALLLSSAWASRCPMQQLEALAASSPSSVALSEGQKLFSAGEMPPCAYLIVTGQFQMVAPMEGGEVVITRAEGGDVIGDVPIALSQPSQLSALSTSPSLLLSFSPEAVRACGWVLARANGRAYDRQLSSPRHTLGLTTKLSHLKVTHAIGCGAFASVAIASKGSCVYVIKKMDRQELQRRRATMQAVRERWLMSAMDHPAICNLLGTFKTQEALFMVLEPCLGGELYTLMREMDVLSEAASRFYVGCIVSALSYMQDRRIVYRDLKPENVVLTASGYAKMVDFGFAKRTSLITHTLCGTPEYLAPEQILCQGHGAAVDWWAVSNLLYEMLIGAAPFVFEGGRPNFNLPPVDLYRNILNKSFTFHLPSHLSSSAVDLMMRMFAFEPIYRLGTLVGGSRDVREHPFFANADFNWEALDAGEMKPPHVPSLSSPTDPVNFEETTTEEPNFLQGSPYDQPPSEWDFDF